MLHTASCASSWERVLGDCPCSVPDLISMITILLIICALNVVRDGREENHRTWQQSKERERTACNINQQVLSLSLSLSSSARLTGDIVATRTNELFFQFSRVCFSFKLVSLGHKSKLTTPIENLLRFFDVFTQSRHSILGNPALFPYSHTIYDIWRLLFMTIIV